MVAGEVRALNGIEGMHRAKRWLDYSTRVAHSWTCTDTVLRDLLEFNWPYGGGHFNFDIGGKFRGGRLHDQSFMVEVKTYRSESNLPEEYRKFLAECYVAYQEKPDRCDHLIWFSWSPFQAQRWDEHRSPESIRKALVHRDNRYRLFGTDDEEQARSKVDESAVFDVSSRLWLITLCEEQEELVIMNQHFGELMKFMQVSQGET